jgi:CubicO group peptidase (beta-lactamase class C family)
MPKFIKFSLYFIGAIAFIALIGFLIFKYYVIPQSKPTLAVSELKETDFFTRQMVDSMELHIGQNSRDKSQVAIAVVVGDSVHCYGIERRGDKLVQIENSDSLFGMGSITKVFTATIYAEMLAKGEIAESTTVDECFGFPLHQGTKITLRSLTNHTSGLPRMPGDVYLEMIKNLEDPFLNYTETWMTEYLKSKLELEKDQIGKSNYSNLGSSILGQVLAKKKSTSYNNLIQEYILDKYQLKNTFLFEQKDTSRVVRPYDIEGNLSVIWGPSVFAPCGLLFVNVRDLAHWIQLQMDPNNLILTKTQLPTVVISEKMKVGTGWHIVNSKTSEYIWHNGGTGTMGGYTSSAAFDPKTNRGVVILSTILASDTEGHLDKLCFGILDFLSNP